MGKQLRSPWVISMAVVLVVFITAAYWLQWSWTGFLTKTLWDWLQLLGVLAIPVVAGFGVAWYTTKQTQASEAAAEQQRKVEREIAANNQCEVMLQAYIDKMSELLFEKKLRQSAVDDEVRNIARMRTLTVLPRLDPKRKASVLQFLGESGLIDVGNRILDLSGADLSNADLSHMDLYRQVWEEGAEEPDGIGFDLSKTNLHSANLNWANLPSTLFVHTNLSNADLSYASLDGDNFFGADLSGADLSRAFVFPTTKKAEDQLLFEVKSLKGAIMPDGSKHP